MYTNDFDYELPPELIAQVPLANRSASRLLIIDRRTGKTRHEQFEHLPSLLRHGDVLVFNNSRVLPARLPGVKSTGGRVELFLVRRLDGGRWVAMTRPGLRSGTRVHVSPEFEAEIESIQDDGMRIVRFDREGERLDAAIHQYGEMPLPPYIRHALDDRERYQTVYACAEGSVAAPTAGLHFTSALLSALQDSGRALEYVTLHVGPGTFQPVKTDRPESHRMHAEWYRIDAATAERLTEARRAGRRIIAVGTTSVRVLESVAHADGSLHEAEGETSIFITPGYQFRAVDAMLTNFHLPRSTLLMLVSAFADRERILAAYQEAIRQGYRFYSFGDCCLLE